MHDEPEAADLAVSIYSGLYNVGIGAGALLGNHIANGFGVSWVGSFGGVVGGLGAGVCWLALRMYARAHPSEHRFFVVLKIKMGYPSLRPLPLGRRVNFALSA